MYEIKVIKYYKSEMTEFEKCISNLTTRAVNTIKDLGGYENMSIYYIDNGHFLNIRNCGNLVNKELIEASILFEKNKRNIIYGPIEKFYAEQKSKLTESSLKLLKKIEIHYRATENPLVIIDLIINDFLSIKEHYILEFNHIDLEEFCAQIQNKSILFHDQYEILKAENCFISYTLNFVEFYNNLKNESSKILKKYIIDEENRNDTPICHRAPLIISKILKNEFYLRDNGYISKKLQTEFKYFINAINDFIDNQTKLEPKYLSKINIIKYIFPKITIQNIYLDYILINDKINIINCININILTNGFFKSLEHKVLLDIYFSEIIKVDLNVLSIKYEKTRERIRQIKQSIDSKIINSIKNIPDNKNFIWPFNKKDNLFSIENNFSFDIGNDIYIKPNSFLIKLIFDELLKSEYYNLELTVFTQKKFKSLNLLTSNIYINSRKINRIIIEEILVLLDNEIFNLYISGIEYDIKILISRFFNLKNIELKNTELEIFSKNINSMIIEFDGSAIERKSEKHQKNSIIHDLVYLYLDEKKTIASTNDLIQLLENNFIKIAAPQLLYILNRYNTFMRYGSTQWALSEWKENGMAEGSFVNIIKNLLIKSENPLHISEIFSEINKHHSTTIHSIYSNLKADKSNSFMFLNCSFVGLINKKYEPYWIKLPKINGSMYSVYNQTLASESTFSIEKYYEAVFGIPQIHTRFILSGANKSTYKK